MTIHHPAGGEQPFRSIAIVGASTRVEASLPNGGTYRIFERVMKQFGLATTYVDPTRTEAFAAALVRPPS